MTFCKNSIRISCQIIFVNKHRLQSCLCPFNQFYIFLARKYASFGHSAFFLNPFGKLSHLNAKYGKSPQKILTIFTLRQHKFSPNVLIWSKYLSIMETKGWYLSIDMCFVLVHCCVGMLMTSCLWGATPIMGRKRITLLQPKDFDCNWSQFSIKDLVNGYHFVFSTLDTLYDSMPICKDVRVVA